MGAPLNQSAEDRYRRDIEREIHYSQVREDIWKQAVERAGERPDDTKEIYISLRLGELLRAKKDQRKAVRSRRQRRHFADSNSPLKGDRVRKRHVAAFVLLTTGLLCGALLLVSC